MKFTYKPPVKGLLVKGLRMRSSSRYQSEDDGNSTSSWSSRIDGVIGSI